MMAGGIGATNYVVIGDTTGTTQVQMTSAVIWVDTLTSPAYAGTLDSIIAWVAPYSESRSLQFIIYKGTDSTVLDTTAVITTGTETANTRYKAYFVNHGAVVADTRYFVGMFWVFGTHSYHPRGVSNATVVKWWYSGALDPAVLPSKLSGMTKTNVGRMAIVAYYSSATAVGQVIMMGN